MYAPPSHKSFDKAEPQDLKRGADHIAPDCAGQNFYAIDRGLRDLLQLYLEPNDFRGLEPHFDRLGALAGGRLDELARAADKHPPVLNARDRFGRDEDWIDYHSSYREMETIAFGDFQFHAMSHRAGTLGMDRPLPAVAKYALQYLFVQAEFGLMCPISVTDTSIHLIRKFASAELKDYLLPKMLSADPATQWKGTQFMTERAGGSDVGAIETTASCEDGVWRLYGDKWFCSHADADVALLLARPEGAPGGTKGLALFALPRRLKDGRRNAYRIVRLKDKLGTRSMASGEIRLEGAVAYLVGEADHGLKQMMEQVNLSRLSHGVRAAAMMRRCVNEAMVCARTRMAFGKTIIEYPLLRRQLLKITVPSEQSLSMFLFAASALDRANAGSKEAEGCLRILTPLLKFRACRDNIPVATGAMEVRGGNGYIEEWVQARLVRDAHIGVLWEGTSNINALDIVTRAVGKRRAHRTLEAALKRLLDNATRMPAAFRNRLRLALDRALVLAERVAAEPPLEASARQAASALYHVTSSILMTWEAAQPGRDARRALYAKFVLEHRLSAQDPLEPHDGDWERAAAEFVFSQRQVALAEIAGLLDRRPVRHQGAAYRIDGLDLDVLPKSGTRPRLLIGGGGPRMLRLAARHADTVGILPAPIRGSDDSDDPADRLPAAFQDKIATVRAAAGDRFGQLELSAFATFIVTSRRRAATEELIVQRGWADLGVEAVWEMPTLFIGSLEQIRADLRERRARFGLSYLITPDTQLPVLADVISGL